MSVLWSDDPIFDADETAHSSMSKHDVRIEPDTIITIDDASRAICSCGWRGMARCYEQDAEADAQRHLNSVED